MREQWDMIIVGGGPGGLQAGIAAASEGLATLVIEKGQVGGQIGQTPLLENSVFANGGITGPQFAEMMRAQAMKMGVTIATDEVIKLVSGEDGHHVLRLKHGAAMQAPIIVLAMGNKWRELDIPGIKLHIGTRVHYGPVRSINYWPTRRAIAVYGGGPSAGQAILTLAEKHYVHAIMRSTLTMPQYLIDRIRNTPHIEVHEQTKIERIETATDAINVVINKPPL